MCTWDSCLIQDNSDEKDDRIGTVTPIDTHHTVVYGPEPCKPVTKVKSSKFIFFKRFFFQLRQIGDLTVFLGGMPRASYGDRYAISAWGAQSHCAFDFSSKIIDFVLSSKLALLVLCEEEFVVIDLASPKWPSHRLPYLSPIHSRNNGILFFLFI